MFLGAGCLEDDLGGLVGMVEMLGLGVRGSAGADGGCAADAGGRGGIVLDLVLRHGGESRGERLSGLLSLVLKLGGFVRTNASGSWDLFVFGAGKLKSQVLCWKNSLSEVKQIQIA